jgi:fatty-acyl-CoA synthase
VFVPLSVLEFRDRAATFFGDKVGVIDGEAQFTYRAFAQRTHRLANALHQLGVGPGDRVSFITFNTHHLLEAYYGVLEAGAVLNPINIRLAPHEIAYILDHASAKVVFFHSDFAPLVEQIVPRLTRRPRFVILDGEAGGIADHEYEALLASGSSEPLHPEIDENAIAELFYTSGTTVLPKGVAMTHRELYLHSLAAEIGIGFTEDDIVLHVVPLFHVNGWGTPHFLTMIGGRHVMSRFDPARSWRSSSGTASPASSPCRRSSTPCSITGSDRATTCRACARSSSAARRRRPSSSGPWKRSSARRPSAATA